MVKTIKQSKSNNIYTFRIFEIKQELTARNHSYNKTCERKTLLNKAKAQNLVAKLTLVNKFKKKFK